MPDLLADIMLARLLGLQKELEDFAAKAELIDVNVKSLQTKQALARGEELVKIRAKIPETIKPLIEQIATLIEKVEHEQKFIETIPSQILARAADATGDRLTAEERRALTEVIAQAVKRLANYCRSLILFLKPFQEALKMAFFPTDIFAEFKNTFVIGVKLFPSWVERDKIALLVPLREAEGFILTLSLSHKP